MGSIRENVLVGRDYLTAADVREALADVGLLDQILQLPLGVETFLPAQGGLLSDSQLQALMLARAIAGKPRLLLIDSALDLLDDRLLESALMTLFEPAAGWTLVVASSVPQVLGRCDQIVRLPSGKVVSPSLALTTPPLRLTDGGQDHE